MALRADESGMELPINIVVMVVVGLAALSALLLMLPKPALQTFTTVTGVDAELDGTPGTYESQAALILKPPAGARESWVKVKIELADKEGKPVRDATCLLRGFGAVLVSKAAGAPGEYEFDGTAAGASKLKWASSDSEGSLSIVCDQVPSGYLKPETRTVTVVVA